MTGASVALDTSPGPGTCGGHVALFYDHDAELAQRAGAFLAEALLAGGSAMAMATGEHARELQAELAAAGVDLRAERRRGSLVLLDPDRTMSGFCCPEPLAAEAFARTVARAVADLAARGGRVHVFGEMVALLWEAGDVLGAIELEEIWSDLGRQHEFTLLCAYPRSRVRLPEQAEALQRICHLHTSVEKPPQPVRPVLEVAAEFPPAIDTPMAARRLLADILDRWAPEHRRLKEDGALLISELVSNAILHARSPVSVVVRCDLTGMRIAVHDFSQVSTLERRGANTGLGLGLQLVASLADDWGVQPMPDGKTVWARLHPPG